MRIDPSHLSVLNGDMIAQPQHDPLRTAALTVVAMMAFAANSLLCREALGQGLIDAASFTSARMISGALTLVVIVLLRRKPQTQSTASWRSALMLFTYMVFFSFAYVSLGAGTGALILFGTVQLTMFFVALRNGEHFSPFSWVGLSLAIAGLVYLVSPGVTAPDVWGAVLMVVSGMAWGAYSLLGRGASDPIETTMKNFVYSVPLVLIISAVFWTDFHATGYGFLLAVVSGAVASGCGYVIWYAALPRLSAIRAATVQLSVPAIAAFGGVMMLSEPLSMRLLIASVATLGGVALVLMQRQTKKA